MVGSHILCPLESTHQTIARRGDIESDHRREFDLREPGNPKVVTGVAS